MIDRTVVIHWSLAVAATAAAYVAWRTPDASGVPEHIVVVGGTPERLSRIDWHEARYDVRVQRTAEQQTEVRVVKRPDPAKPGDPAARVQPEEVQVFPGSEQAMELFARLVPLAATRALGAVSPEELTQFELDAPSSTINLTFGDERHEIGLGKSTYGTGDLYARAPDGGVFLLPSKLLGQLRYGASALLDRRVLGLERPAIERVVLQRGAVRRELVHRYGDQPDKAFFAEPAEPESKLERLSALMDRVLRLRIDDFVDGRAPVEEPLLHVTFLRADEQLGKISLWGADATGATAVSSRFARPMRLSRATVDQILRDVDDVLVEGL